MTSLYECDAPGCDWRNPDWRYGFADAGATWADHMADHRRRSVHNHPPYRPVCNERRLADGQLRGACLNDDGTPSETDLPPAGGAS